MTRIISVEDDPDIRALLQLELRASGYDTAFARDGLGGPHADPEDAPDLILLDIGLPAGDGFTVMDRLKNFPALEGIPIIVVAASANPQIHERALAAGALAFIKKPFNTESLLGEIERALAPSTPPSV